MLGRALTRNVLSNELKCIERCQWRAASSKSSAELIDMENKYVARTYDPIPVVAAEGKGCILKDVEGKRYLDFLAGYAAVNTGHCHPKIVETLVSQAAKLTHTSRAYYNNELPVFAEYITKYFGYDRVLPMNTGVEGGETAVKMARRWGYLSKGIKANEAVVIFANGNFWGRSLAAVSSSDNMVMYEHFGPYMPGFKLLPFNDTRALEEAFKDKNVCAFMVEPIQGEGGIIVPTEGYLKEVRRLCTEYNVLFIADEVQTGLGRTGELLACDHECVKPDILVLGKGLAGAFIPGSDEVKKAMNKSFVESGGTELNTNWGAVGNDKVSIKPPDGMEWRTWDK